MDVLRLFLKGANVLSEIQTLANSAQSCSPGAMGLFK